jgi:hypothetical protein
VIILLGSKALAHYIPDFKTSIDTDILGEYDSVVSYMKSKGQVQSIYPSSKGKKLITSFSDKTIIEAEINWGHSSPKMMTDLMMNDPDTKIKLDYEASEMVLIPSLDFLYTLKMSHRYLRNSPHFLKTMKHIHLMRSMGAKIRPEYQEFYKIRREETYWYKHPKLNVTKDDFFSGDGVKYIYDHDSIHKAIKHLDNPAYEYYKSENADILCDRKKWDECSEEIKLYGVLEEVQVLALERSQIPFEHIDPRKSFNMAHEKVCTSITSGFFREFAYENYHKIQVMYESDYVERFWDQVNLGNVPFANPEVEVND